MKYLAIFNYTTGHLTVVRDPELEPSSTEDVYENYISETFDLKPSEFHYMTGTSIAIDL